MPAPRRPGHKTRAASLRHRPDGRGRFCARSRPPPVPPPPLPPAAAPRESPTGFLPRSVLAQSGRFPSAGLSRHLPPSDGRREPRTARPPSRGCEAAARCSPHGGSGGLPSRGSSNRPFSDPGAALASLPPPRPADGVTHPEGTPASSAPRRGAARANRPTIQTPTSAAVAEATSAPPHAQAPPTPAASALGRLRQCRRLSGRRRAVLDRKSVV